MLIRRKQSDKCISCNFTTSSSSQYPVCSLTGARWTHVPGQQTASWDSGCHLRLTVPGTTSVKLAGPRRHADLDICSTCPDWNATPSGRQCVILHVLL